MFRTTEFYGTKGEFSSLNLIRGTNIEAPYFLKVDCRIEYHGIIKKDIQKYFKI